MEHSLENVGKELLERYKIDKLLGQGSFAQVYKVIDSQDEQRPLVAKIQKENISDEVKIMQQFMEVIDSGSVQCKNKIG